MADIQEVEGELPESGRGSGGFGSTGVKEEEEKDVENVVPHELRVGGKRERGDNEVKEEEDGVRIGKMLRFVSESEVVRENEGMRRKVRMH